MRRLSCAIVTLLCCCGCSGDDAPPPTPGALDASTESSSVSHACTWPVPAAICTQRADFRVCVVDERKGQSEAADGTVLDANGKPVPGGCKNACKSTEYALTCSGDAVLSRAFEAPLGCTLVPISTPPGVAIWCCPCVE